MIAIETPSPTPDPPSPPAPGTPASPPQHTPHEPRKPSLADLSRNASVISNSSADSESSNNSTVLKTPRPRPIRTFSSPRYRSRSPAGPSTPRGSRPPAYLAKELGLATPEKPPEPQDQLQPGDGAPMSRRRAQSKSKSRSSSANGRLGAEDFDFGDILGEGSYSTVHYAKHRATGQEYAIKVLDKAHLKRNNKMSTALAEKNTLVRLGSGHPGIVKLHSAFQDEWSLFFVLDLAKNGELQTRISRMGSLSIPCARYYTAQLIDALDYMHSKGVIHRDLKPENILLDEAFRIKVTDFGTGKLIDVGTDTEQRAKTFVGTAQYVSPELLEANETSKSSDLWALGCVIYQMIAGRFAFQGLSEYLTWQKIKHLEYTFPEGFDPDARDLVTRLLVRDPLLRLGAGAPGEPNSMAALRAHMFLASIQWDTLWTAPAPPLEPGLVKREHPLGPGPWDDVGKAWDELVGGSDGDEDDEDDDEDEDDDTGTARYRVGGDGIEWAPDCEGAFTLFARRKGDEKALVLPPEVGPLGELRPLVRAADEKEKVLDERPLERAGAVQFALPVDVPEEALEEEVTAKAKVEEVEDAEADVEDEDGVKTPVNESPPMTWVQPPTPSPGANGAPPANGASSPAVNRTTSAKRKSQPVSVPSPVRRDAYSTSSSDGSPVEKALEAMGINRGRLRTRSPPRANAPSEPDWASVLAPGEQMLFTSPVEETVTKRRTSRLLLPLPVTPRKPKPRQLALTSTRLVCLKPLKGGRGVGVKCEYGLRPSAKEKERAREKEERMLVLSAEKKGEREFVVLTETKSAFYVAQDEALAAAWVQKISEARDAHASQSRERTLSARS